MQLNIAQAEQKVMGLKLEAQERTAQALESINNTVDVGCMEALEQSRIKVCVLCDLSSPYCCNAWPSPLLIAVRSCRRTLREAGLLEMKQGNSSERRMRKSN